jgi:hemoglobin-like flavoprotein
MASLLRRWIMGETDDDRERARDVIEGARADDPQGEWDPHTDPRDNGASAARPNATPEWSDEYLLDDVEHHPGQHAAHDDAGSDLEVIRPSDSGVHSLPEPVDGFPIECRHCGGQGVIVRTVGDLLGESVGMIEDGGALVLQFYRNLLDAAPYLAELFPADLLTAAVNDQGSRGAKQRDKLLEAILALAQLYRPDDPDRMAQLDGALVSMGNRHAAFRRPSTGRVSGASVSEYAAVKQVFLVTVHAMVPGWRGEHDLAWDEAYEYAARGMLGAQHAWLKEHAGQAVFPRERRESR